MVYDFHEILHQYLVIPNIQKKKMLKLQKMIKFYAIGFNNRNFSAHCSKIFAGEFKIPKHFQKRKSS